MQLNQINLNGLRVFASVYRTGSMTVAAAELHLTQSGVSQHIKTLEEAFGFRLFDRIGRKILPTPRAKNLYEACQKALYKLEEGLVSVGDETQNHSGLVRLAMPVEYGANVIAPILASIGRKFPSIQFRLTLDYAAQLIEPVQRGELDFAIVDDFDMGPLIEMRKLSEEHFELCASKTYMKGRKKENLTRRDFESMDYIAYQGGEPILRKWMYHHLRAKKIQLNIRAQVMDVQAVARLIIHGLGVGILPNHLLEKLIRTYNYPLKVLRVNSRPFKNTISMAHLSGRTQPPWVSKVMEEIQHRISQ